VNVQQNGNISATFSGPRAAMRAAIRSELARDAAQSDRAIARTLGCSHRTVAVVRAEPITTTATETPPMTSNTPATRSTPSAEEMRAADEMRAKIDAELERDPLRPNREIAELLGCSRRDVASVRLRRDSRSVPERRMYAAQRWSSGPDFYDPHRFARGERPDPCLTLAEIAELGGDEPRHAIFLRGRVGNLLASAALSGELPCRDNVRLIETRDPVSGKVLSTRERDTPRSVRVWRSDLLVWMRVCAPELIDTAAGRWAAA
jgi:hypothetical protein